MPVPRFELQPSRPRFLALQPLLPDKIWPFLWLHTVRPIQVFYGGPLSSDHQQVAWKTVQTFPEPVHSRQAFDKALTTGERPAKSPGMDVRAKKQSGSE